MKWSFFNLMISASIWLFSAAMLLSAGSKSSVNRSSFLTICAQSMAAVMWHCGKVIRPGQALCPRPRPPLLGTRAGLPMAAPRVTACCAVLLAPLEGRGRAKEAQPFARANACARRHWHTRRGGIGAYNGKETRLKLTVNLTKRSMIIQATGV